jgi:hypothetical protein
MSDAMVLRQESSNGMTENWQNSGDGLGPCIAIRFCSV